MEELIPDLEQLKISAFSKVKQINHCVHEVTIGPNSNKNKEQNKPELLDKIKKHENKCEIFTSKNEYPIRHVLKELEIQRQEQVKNAVRTHIYAMEKFSKQQEAIKKERWLKQQQAFIEDMRQKEFHILEALREYDKNTSNEHAKLIQHYKNLAERRKMHEMELEAKEKQKTLMNLYIDNVKKSQFEFRATYQQIIAVIKTCPNNEELKKILGEDFQQLKTLPEQLDEVITNCKNGKVSELEVQRALGLVSQIGTLLNKIENSVAKIKETKATATTSEVTVSSHSTDENKAIQMNAAADQTSELSYTININLSQYVSLSNIKLYNEIIGFLQQHLDSFKQLELDSSQKQFKFDCKKAINTPVNSLSGINSSHILDKYNRLFSLLSGRSVTIGDKHINASSHPQGIAFCMDLLAKKFVLQGDLMVSSNPESAFCYATVIVSLWNDFPTFGKLILAYFYKLCPYLVPYYIPQQVGESNEEYYTKQGYQYIDGQIETQDKFLKRMTGIMRLYSAILIVKPRGEQSTTPHNLKHGWRWLSSILNLTPRVDISATMVHTFLETVGFEMEAKYGRFFKKQVRIILEKFLPNCRAKCTGGSVTRLELLLNEYMKNNKFEQPNGYLNYPYW